MIPHVFTSNGDVEHDPDACLEVFNSVSGYYKDRVFLVRGEYNHNEMKHIIGLCDLFIGSRMHSCIAAMSQSIPTVGLAYSKKFKGVFETVGMDQYVADMRYNNDKNVLKIISRAFDERQTIKKRLEKTIPEIQKKILSIFDDLL